MEESEKREKAWIGDAVLGLFARQWILQQPEIKPGQRIETFTHLTSNHFLSSFGEPTAVEAKIGQVYEEEGIAGAFQWIETAYLPMFKKQQVNRTKGKPGQKRTK